MAQRVMAEVAGGTWRGLVVAALVLVAAVAAGAGYQIIGMARDRRRYGVASKLVDVGGHRLYLSAVGAGSPTVVMDAGLGHVSTVWCLVQPEVATFARVCVYDRAGYGWSEVGPAPRTSQRIAEELHTLLEQAGIEPPYVLVGHSFGALNMYLYALRYPAEVAGLVFVDALSPHIGVQSPGEMRWFVGWNRVQYRIQTALTRVGLMRAYVRGRGVTAGPRFVRQLPATVQPMALAELLRETYAAAAAETGALPASLAGAHRAAAPLNVPLVALAHGVPDMFAGRMSPREVIQAERAWQALQADVARLSTQGTLVVAEQAGHRIHIDRPAIVIDAIRRVVQMVRQGQPLGMTVTPETDQAAG